MKNKILKQFSCVLLILTALFSASCGEKPIYLPQDTEPDDTASTAVTFPPSDDSQAGVYQPWMGVGMGRFLEADNYIWRTEAGYFRLNLKTGIVTGLCADPICRHDNEGCPLYNASVEVVDGENVYFVRSINETTSVDPSNGRPVTDYDKSLWVYNISSGKTRKLADLNEEMFFYAVYDGKLYYTRKTVVDEDHTAMYLYRSSVEHFGQDEELVFRPDPLNRDGAQRVFNISAGYAYFSVGDHALIRLDLKTGDQVRLDFGDAMMIAPRVGQYIFYRGPDGDPVEHWPVLDGRGKQQLNADGTPMTVPAYSLYYMRKDLSTGEVIRLSDEPDGIGTTPTYLDSLTAKYVYLPFSDGLWRCDHDGNKLGLVQTTEQLAARPEYEGCLKIFIGEVIFYILDDGNVEYFNMQTGEYSG